MGVGKDHRARLKSLHDWHIGFENEHDVDGVVATFTPAPENALNGVASVQDPEQVRAGHASLGFSTELVGFRDLQVVPAREHYTDREIVIEGHVTGRHLGDQFGFPPSNEAIALPYVCAYRFNEEGLLESERLTLDFSQLARGALAAVRAARSAARNEEGT